MKQIFKVREKRVLRILFCSTQQIVILLTRLQDQDRRSLLCLGLAFRIHHQKVQRKVSDFMRTVSRGRTCFILPATINTSSSSSYVSVSNNLDEIFKMLCIETVIK